MRWRLLAQARVLKAIEHSSVLWTSIGIPIKVAEILNHFQYNTLNTNSQIKLGSKCCFFVFLHTRLSSWWVYLLKERHPLATSDKLSAQVQWREIEFIPYITAMSESSSGILRIIRLNLILAGESSAFRLSWVRQYEARFKLRSAFACRPRSTRPCTGRLGGIWGFLGSAILLPSEDQYLILETSP